jgi:hypothetical protein
VERVNSDRDPLISTTSNDDKIYARIAIMSARTTGAIANELLTKIRRSSSKLLESDGVNVLAEAPTEVLKRDDSQRPARSWS